MNFLKKSAAVLVLLFCAFSSQAEGINFLHVSLEEAIKKSKEENKPLFIDIYATWCGPCKYLTREVFVDEELGKYMNANFINLKIDGEFDDGDALMTDFELNAYPTMLFLSPEKELLEKIVGAVSAEEIQSTANDALHPELSQLFLMGQKYDAGETDKQFLQDYIDVLMEKDEDFDPVVDTYIDLYPEFNLEDEGEFFVFCLGVDDLTNKYNIDFLDNLAYYHEMHGDVAIGKMQILLIEVANRAKEAQNTDIIDEGLELLYEPYSSLLDEFVSEADLKDALLEIYYTEE